MATTEFSVMEKALAAGYNPDGPWQISPYQFLADVEWERRAAFRAALNAEMDCPPASEPAFPAEYFDATH